MRIGVLPIHDGLRDLSRLAARLEPGEEVRLGELAALAAAGASAAALTTFVDLSLRIPGHHILFAVFPMALGLALVPRRRAGGVMGCAALLSSSAFWMLGARLPGMGAISSLLATGPALDAAVRWAGRGWRLYAAFMLAGLTSNFVAFLVRAAAKLLAIPGFVGSRPFATWWLPAIVTYAAAGILAGATSAAVWFKLRRRERSEEDGW
jgi:hypothetical protein